MSGLTQKAIKASVLKLLNEKPYSQITIKDIVEDCGINRNSFYYHFRDLPSLVEEMVLEEADRLISEYPSITSLEECVDAAVSFAVSNKKAAYHIYNSVSRDVYETYLWRICEYVVKAYLDNVIGDAYFDGNDRQVIIDFYKCACFGTVMDWQRNGMKDDIKTRFTHLFEFKKSMLESFAGRLKKH